MTDINLSLFTTNPYAKPFTAAVTPTTGTTLGTVTFNITKGTSPSSATQLDISTTKKSLQEKFAHKPSSDETDKIFQYIMQEDPESQELEQVGLFASEELTKSVTVQPTSSNEEQEK